MKKLSDYRDEEAIEVWADIVEPLSIIMTDKEVKETWQKGVTIFSISKIILKRHAKEVKEILLAVDDTPINGINIFQRLISFMQDLLTRDDSKGFFSFAEPKEEKESFGSATESIKDGEK